MQNRHHHNEIHFLTGKVTTGTILAWIGIGIIFGILAFGAFGQSIAAAGTLEPHAIYLVKLNGDLMPVVTQAREDGTVQFVVPDPGQATIEFLLWATATPTPYLYPTSTPTPTATPTVTNTPTPTPTLSPTPPPTFPPPPPTPVWHEVTFNDLYATLIQYREDQREWWQTRAHYQKMGWPLN